MKWVWTRTKYDPKYNQAPVRACLSENEALRKRVAELEAALEHNNSALDGANAIIARLEADPFERWKRCPSTHCERRGECASPHECLVKLEPSDGTRALVAKIS